MSETPQHQRFSAIYAEHAEHVWRAARRFGVPPEQLPDVLQDVWLSVHRQLETVDTSRPLRPWLTVVVWNHVRHLRRGYARRVRKEEALVVAEEFRGGTSEVSQREARWTLERVLAKLPDEQREVLLLCDGEGLSAPEVSEALGVELNTVYSRLRLARRRCQAAAATLGVAGWAALLRWDEALPGPSPGELAALAAAVSRRSAGTAAPMGVAAGKAKLVVGAGALIAATVAGLVWTRGAQVTAPVVRVAAPELVPQEEPTREAPLPGLAAVPALPSQAIEPVESRRSPRRKAGTAAALPPQEEVPLSRKSLRAEHRLIDDARDAYGAGNLSEALALLDEHRRDYPNGASADIRDLLRVRIHCARGNLEKARAIAALYPADPQFAAHIEQRCGKGSR